MQATDYHGYQVSCFGMKDGAIDLTVSGGAAPYWYKWSTGASSEDIAQLPAGYYKVDVYDDSGQRATAEITLEQPLPMKLDVDVYEYPNGYNESCFDCFNGNASVVVMGGAAPFTISWSDGPTGAIRSNLGPKDYKITVTDGNACAGASTTIYLRGPARSDWSMGGNASSNPATQYLGTSDAQDLVLKSNGQERLRLKGNGDIGLWGADTTVGPIYRDFDGTLKIGGGPVLPSAPVNPDYPCFLLGAMPYWKTTGNDFTYLCPGQDTKLGTLSDDPLKMITNGQERMRLTEDGKVGIGTSLPEATLHVQGDLLVRGGTNGEGDIVTSSNATTGAVIWARNAQAAWGLSIDADGHGHILGDWNNPHPIMTFTYNKVGIGTDDMPGDDYSLYVAKGILTEKVKVALQSTADWSDYVFQPGYALMPLRDVDAFIKRNGHLPGVPSAATMVEQGLDVAKTDAILMEKVEELTLHLINMEERIAHLEMENAELRSGVGKQ